MWVRTAHRSYFVQQEQHFPSTASHVLGEPMISCHAEEMTPGKSWRSQEGSLPILCFQAYSPLPSCSGVFRDLRTLLMLCPPPSSHVSPSSSSCALSFSSGRRRPLQLLFSHSLPFPFQKLKHTAVFRGPHHSQMALLSLTLSSLCARWRKLCYL